MQCFLIWCYFNKPKVKSVALCVEKSPPNNETSTDPHEDCLNQTDHPSWVAKGSGSLHPKREGLQDHQPLQKYCSTERWGKKDDHLSDGEQLCWLQLPKGRVPGFQGCMEHTSMIREQIQGSRDGGRQGRWEPGTSWTVGTGDSGSGDGGRQGQWAPGTVAPGKVDAKDRGPSKGSIMSL